MDNVGTHLSAMLTVELMVWIKPMPLSTMFPPKLPILEEGKPNMWPIASKHRFYACVMMANTRRRKVERTIAMDVVVSL